MKCESCNSTNVKKYKTTLNLIHDEYGKLDVKIEMYVCQDCEEEFFDDENAQKLIDIITKFEAEQDNSDIDLEQYQ